MKICRRWRLYIYKMLFASLFQEAKKKYDKETEKYCAVLEKHLSLSARKKESHLHEVRCCVRVHSLIGDISHVFLVNVGLPLFIICCTVVGGQPGR